MNTYFKQLRKRSLYENVASEILNLILEGKFQVGDRLPGEREMAEQLGVNRGTLREALRVLEFMRVIEKRIGEGVFVTATDADMGLETVIFRFMSEDGLNAESLAAAHEAATRIEGVMAELAAERALPGELAELKLLHQKMEDAVDSGEHFTALDREFHLALGRSGKSPVLLSIASSVWVIVERYALILYGLKENRAKCIEDHRKIISALEKGQARQSRRLAEDHLLWARQALFELDDI